MRSLAIGVLLSAAGGFAQPAAAPAFDVASIKLSADPPGNSAAHTRPGSLRVQNRTLKECIMAAYQVQDFQISGGPKWLESERYNIDAKAAGPADDDQLMLMLRTLLAERFQLAFHRETRPVQGYAMVLAKGGLKLKPDETEGDYSANTTRNCLTASHMSMADLAALVAARLGIPVADATGVPGGFDITMKWTPEEERPKASAASSQPVAPQDAAAGPSLLEVLQEQLGLKLEPRKVSIQVLVIDRAAKPPEN